MRIIVFSDMIDIIDDMFIFEEYGKRNKIVNADRLVFKKAG